MIKKVSTLLSFVPFFINKKKNLFKSVLRISQKIDTLMEVANIGTAHAANALAKIIGERVDIETPDVEMLNVNEFIDTIAKMSGRLFVCWTQIRGIVNAFILTIFQHDDMVKLLQLDVKSKSLNSYDELPESLKTKIIKAGNSFGEAYVNSIGNLLNKTLAYLPSKIHLSSFSNLLSLLKENLKLDENLSLIITTKIIIQKFNVEGSISFIPNHKKTKELLKLLSELY